MHGIELKKKWIKSDVKCEINKLEVYVRAWYGSHELKYPENTPR